LKEGQGKERSGVCLDNFDDDISDTSGNSVFRIGQSVRTDAYANDETNAVFTFDSNARAPRFGTDFRLELLFGFSS